MNRAQWKTWRIKRMEEIDQQKLHSEVPGKTGKID